MSLNREGILQLLHQVDDALEDALPPGTDLRLILIGGAAAILRYGSRRMTHDVDAASPSPRGGAYLERLGLHIVPDSNLNLPEDYGDRLVAVEERFRHFRLFVLGPYDLAVSKISRGEERDFYDVFGSELRGRLDWNELERIYRKSMANWIGQQGMFEVNLGIAREYFTHQRNFEVDTE